MHFRRFGRCPACLHRSSLVRHHCHLRDLVKRVIVSLNGVRAHRVLSSSFWRRDPRVLAAVRFPDAFVCRRCNSLDAVDLQSRPSRWFSLAPVEMQRVRRLAGTRVNRGRSTKAALGQVRLEALSAHRGELREAVRVGHVLVEEYEARQAGRSVRQNLVSCRPDRSGGRS